jgi:hypothetical protein
MSLEGLVAIFGGWSVVLLGISAWLSKLLSERVLSAWRRDEQREIETLRSGLADSRVVLEAAIRSHSAGQDLFQQRRLEAVDKLWATARQLREDLRGPVFFFSVLLPSEYDSQLAKGGAIAASIEDVTEESILSAMQAANDVEIERPHLGETLWLKFFIYRAFLGRLAFLVLDGKQKGHIEDWREDSGVRQILSHLLTDETLASLLAAKNDPTAINRAVNALEGTVLEDISRITSGRQSSFESFENSERLREAVASLEAGERHGRTPWRREDGMLGKSLAEQERSHRVNGPQSI